MKWPWRKKLSPRERAAQLREEAVRSRMEMRERHRYYTAMIAMLTQRIEALDQFIADADAEVPPSDAAALESAFWPDLRR